MDKLNYNYNAIARRSPMKRAVLIILAVIFISTNMLFAADGETYTKDIPYSGEKILKAVLEFGMAELQISRTEGDYIARINGEYDPDKFTVDVNYDNSSGQGQLVIKVENKKSLFNFSKHDDESDNSWEIELGDRCPVDLSIDAGMASVDLDFTGLEVTGLDIDAGMASGTIAFNKPNKGHIDELVLDAGKSSLECRGFGNANFGRLVVDAGMASVELDFSGSLEFEGEIELDAGMSSANVILNPNMGTQIKYSEGWTATVDVPNGFVKVKKGVYRSDGYDQKKGHLDFDLDVSMGSVDFKLAQSL
jgi:hypothetical protein